jgi:hypothetical protein
VDFQTYGAFCEVMLQNSWNKFRLGRYVSCNENFHKCVLNQENTTKVVKKVH